MSTAFALESIPASHAATERIPRIFHFTFGMQRKPQVFHLIHYLCLESCLQVNRPDKIFFHCHREPTGRYWELVKDKVQVVATDLVPEVSSYQYKDKYIKKNFLYAHHSDFVRIDVLNKNGGIYADLDTIFVNELPSHLYDKLFVMGREPPIADIRTKQMRESVCNALIMSRAHSDFGSFYYDSMAEALDGSWSNHSCYLAADLSRKFPDLIHVEPQDSFYKHRWDADGIRTMLLGCDRDFTCVYSMHLWAHLWWSKKRKDFSSFHAGNMTEEFVRSVDTTYNIVARKFLPPKKTSKVLWFGRR